MIELIPYHRLMICLAAMSIIYMFHTPSQSTLLLHVAVAAYYYTLDRRDLV